MFGFSKVIAVALVFLVTAGTARADMILQSKGVTLGSIGLDTVAFQPFDDSLGTLNEAILTASLNFSYLANTIPLVNSAGQALPATVGGSIDFQIDGLSWPFYFQMTCYTFRTQASGTPMIFPVNLSASWRSNALSDLMGFTVGSVGTGGSCAPDPLNPVQFSDYIATPISSILWLQTDIRSIWTATSSTGGFFTATGGGVLQLYYDYTPGSTVISVPEPASIALIGIGLAALGFTSRKKS